MNYVPKKIIDNSDVKLSTFLNSVLEEIPNTQFDIATTFFNIQAYAFIKDKLIRMDIKIGRDF